MASMDTRLNIEKLDGNIIQKHEGSKQVGLKQLGSKQAGFKQLGVKQVGFKQLGHGVEQESMEYIMKNMCGLSWNCRELKEIVKLKFFRPTQQFMKSEIAKHLSVAGIQRQNGLVDETNVTLFAKVTIISDWIQEAYRYVKVFGWLASIKQGMLEPVKVKCIFLGYRKGTGSVQVLQGVEFKVEPQEDHTFEVEPYGNVDQVVVAVVDMIYAYESLTFNNTVASTVARNEVTTAMAITGSIHQATKGLLDKAKGNIFGMEIVRDQSGNTLRVSQSRFYNEKLVRTLLEGQFILSLEGSL
uniref:Zinc finger, CCHC-type n=1 Tax=Tanacetum cinerariifolium TaxID=118510 RepID=A0A6L2LAP7_TANCI|nr:zinc finger, CCHC-type [Tanacetum cinerariifolium]